MSVQEVSSPGRAAEGARERTRILALAALIVGAVAFYLTFGVSRSRPDGQRNLLPYQALARTLAQPEQQMYSALRRGLAEVEADRAGTSRWPEPLVLQARGVPPFANGSNNPFEWQKFQQGATVNYLGLPADPSAPAWLLAIQEPEPNQPPDPAPNDDEHHRLPDGTTLHIYVWTHRFGGRVNAKFTPQPQSDGWTEIFAAPPNPVLPARRP
jgi:hypothetical protein